ncbi:MAG: transketolase [Alicyclobacillus macrosporangiidus]|uniref:transketolase n=1 Tax=Alicyclobacillus macrosporangiidus TaxID=392015 RepID=UPI0026E98044|nr:transketolase [Alicyclobacillus macrosporangiidus]MCL6597612.1 transketolase [Alicyclobacillus macrosporangiidus]
MNPLQYDRQQRIELIREKAKLSRLEAIRLISLAGSGHYGSSFSCAEIFATLYYHVLRYRVEDPKWPERDRFVMGKGHAAVGLYPLLADVGFFSPDLLDTYASLGSPFGDHPDMNKIPGVDFSSGSLGHGISVSVGMALGARLDGRAYRVFCLLGDGELQEGQVWEAAMSAANFKLGNLIGLLDNNKVTVDGFTADLMSIHPIREKWESFGWRVVEVDGHDPGALMDVFDALPDPSSEQPTLIICDTVSGKGVSWMENTFEWHVANLSAEDMERAIAEIKGGTCV